MSRLQNGRFLLPYSEGAKCRKRDPRVRNVQTSQARRVALAVFTLAPPGRPFARNLTASLAFAKNIAVLQSIQLFRQGCPTTAQKHA